jgi:hypothetical protein
VPSAKTVEDILDWAEYRIAQHHNREEFESCLAIAQEFDEWFNTKKGDDYHIYFYPPINHDR